MYVLYPTITWGALWVSKLDSAGMVFSGSVSSDSHPDIKAKHQISSSSPPDRLSASPSQTLYHISTSLISRHALLLWLCHTLDLVLKCVSSPSPQAVRVPCDSFISNAGLSKNSNFGSTKHRNFRGNISFFLLRISIFACSLKTQPHYQHSFWNI